MVQESAKMVEPIEYRIRHDTLSLVSSSWFLYYPFGTFKNREGLKRNFQAFYSEENEFYYLKDEESYAKLVRDDGREALELIYAKISSPGIRLDNGIVIGMSKPEVFSKFFKTMPVKMDSINVLKLESERKRIWHYYNFKNGVLDSFCFNTDYQEDKKK